MLENFFENAVVIDVETTGLNPDDSDILEFGMSTFDGTDWTAHSQLYKPPVPIPFAASAINGISRRMVEHQPSLESKVDDLITGLSKFKYFVSHNVMYDRSSLKYNFAKLSRFPKFVSDENKNNWICTLKIAKKLLIDEGIAHNQQFLRYYFDLDELMDQKINLNPHRASSDAYICGHLLMALVSLAAEKGLIDLEKDLGPQLVDLTWKTIPLTAWPHGKKYKGVPFKDIPDSFYLWALENMEELNEKHHRYNEDLAEAVRIELESRLELK